MKKQQKKEKKEKNQPTEPEQDTTPITNHINLQVGIIREIKPHEKADTLYIEEIDVGEKTTRTIVSGIRPFYTVDQLLNQKVVVITNLKPAKLRGVLSSGMLLAASNPDHTKVEIVSPPESSEIGERICLGEKIEGQPDRVLNPKKKYWETVQMDLKTKDDLVAYYKDFPLKTKSGNCVVKSLKGAKIK
eukprot:Anaeramoba_ignava/a478239_365.p3 GENE.a478239_365~~a478239_365.p3  ORF type:complete len:189 (+),score=81.21 a478239_365:3451-4017(+)